MSIFSILIDITSSTPPHSPPRRIAMTSFVPVKDLVARLRQELKGFPLAPSQYSPRLLQLTFSHSTVEAFLAAMAEWPVQALEYKSFLRFRAAKLLDELCAGTLQPLLINTLVARDTGRLLITPHGLDSVEQADDMVKLATAVAQLFGRSNYDAMSGQY